MVTIALYLIRHGLAGERGTYANDDERPLTKQGKQKTQQVAKQLKALNLQFDRMLTSPFVRAAQTAEILLEANLCDRLETMNFLAHGGRLEDFLDWLSSWHSQAPSQPSSDPYSLALVGHEPDLSQWAERLIWGEARGGITLKKAGVLGLMVPLENSIAHSTLFWVVPPRLLL